MIGWIVLAAAVFYLVVGSAFARMVALRLFRYNRDANVRGGFSPEKAAQLSHTDTAILVPVIAVAWPVVAPIVAARWVTTRYSRWLMVPVRRDQARVAALRADAERWDRARYTGTPAEQEMAAELAALCRARADDLDGSGR